MTADKTKLELGIIGCGRIVEEAHAPALLTLGDRARVAAVADPSAERRHAVLKLIGTDGVAQYEDWKAMLEAGGWLMERLDPEVVALGPDTGHLAWAGADPAQIVRRYGRRVKAAHIKDLRREVAERNRGSKRSYKEVVAQGLWAEPCCRPPGRSIASSGRGRHAPGAHSRPGQAQVLS